MLVSVTGERLGPLDGEELSIFGLRVVFHMERTLLFSKGNGQGARESEDRELHLAPGVAF